MRTQRGFWGPEPPPGAQRLITLGQSGESIRRCVRRSLVHAEALQEGSGPSIPNSEPPRPQLRPTQRERPSRTRRAGLTAAKLLSYGMAAIESTRVREVLSALLRSRFVEHGRVLDDGYPHRFSGFLGDWKAKFRPTQICQITGVVAQPISDRRKSED